MTRYLFLLAYLASMPVAAISAHAGDVRIEVTLAPEDFESRGQVKGAPQMNLVVPENALETTIALDVEAKQDGQISEYEFPRLILRANALMSGTYRVVLYGFKGDFDDRNWNSLVNSRRVLKFDFPSQDELFRYLALSNFEIRRRVVNLAAGAQLEAKTAQILYHYLRLWVAISQDENFVIAPAERPFAQVVRLLSEFEADNNRSDSWFWDNTRIPRKEFATVVAQARAMRTNSYQKIYQSILEQESCQSQAALLRRMANSFDQLTREEQTKIAANFNAARNAPTKSPDQWRQQIQGDIRDRDDRAAKRLKCTS